MSRRLACALIIFCLLALCVSATAQSSSPASEIMSKELRAATVSMLREIKDTVQKNYYDPGFHGIDLNARFNAAEEKLKTVPSFSEAMGVIAWALEPLDDSHTFFVPPDRPYAVDRGWRADMVGDKCLITAVRPGSDAEAKGLKPGDEILAIENFRPTRDNVWKLEYAFDILAPRSATHLLVATPPGPPRQLLVESKYKALKKNLFFNTNCSGPGCDDEGELLRRHSLNRPFNEPRWAELENGVLALKLPSFILDEADSNKLLHRFDHHSGIVLDLRGNPGGYETRLLDFLAKIFDHDVAIGDSIERKKQKPLRAKHSHDSFGGKLVVLIDSRSGSSSEIFARVVQLEKRGVVLGDRSSGSVRRARPFMGSEGGSTFFLYGVQVTTADLVMRDGGSLEKNGVTPDEVVLPTPEDLAAGRDPVLAYAAALLGAKINAEQAGKLFPVLWKDIDSAR